MKTEYPASAIGRSKGAYAWAATPPPETKIKPEFSGNAGKNWSDSSASTTVIDALFCSRLGSTPRVRNEFASRPVDTTAQMMKARCSHFRHRGFDRFGLASGSVCATALCPVLLSNQKRTNKEGKQRTSKRHGTCTDQLVAPPYRGVEHSESTARHANRLSEDTCGQGDSHLRCIEPVLVTTICSNAKHAHAEDTRQPEHDSAN